MQCDGNEKPVEDKKGLSEKEMKEIAHAYVEGVSKQFEHIVNGFFMHNVWLGLFLLECGLYFDSVSRNKESVFCKIIAIGTMFGLLISICANIVRCRKLKKCFYASTPDLVKTLLSIITKNAPYKDQNIFMVMCAVNVAALIASIYFLIIKRFSIYLALFTFFFAYIIRGFGMGLVRKTIFPPKE